MKISYERIKLVKIDFFGSEPMNGVSYIFRGRKYWNTIVLFQSLFIYLLKLTIRLMRNVEVCGPARSMGQKGRIISLESYQGAFQQ